MSTSASTPLPLTGARARTDAKANVDNGQLGPRLGRSARNASHLERGPNSHWTALQRAIAVVAVVILGMRMTLVSSINVTAGLAVSLLFAPLWLPVTRQFRGARILTGLGLAAVAAGVVLTSINAGDHGSSTKALLANSVMLLTLLTGTGLILWSRTVISPGAIAGAFGTGMLLGVSSTSGLYASNPWRFGFSVPITVLVLGLALLLGRRSLELAAAFLLMLVSAASDARSSSAILLLTALFVTWQMISRPKTGKGSALRIVVAVGLLAAVVYNVGQSLILNGSLGEETQQRSQAQVDTSGSLILGGRPELAATTNLMAHHPFGFGSGTIPSHDDLNSAKAGMAAINYDPNNGYVERFMFGSGYELHSTIGDLWANFGLVGLAFAAAVLGIVLRAFGESMSGRAASGIVLFLTVKMLWNLFFAPLGSAVPLLMLLLGLVLIRKAGPNPELDLLSAPILPAAPTIRRRSGVSR